MKRGPVRSVRWRLLNLVWPHPPDFCLLVGFGPGYRNLAQHRLRFPDPSLAIEYGGRVLSLSVRFWTSPTAVPFRCAVTTNEIKTQSKNRLQNTLLTNQGFLLPLLLPRHSTLFYSSPKFKYICLFPPGRNGRSYNESARLDGNRPLTSTIVLITDTRCSTPHDSISDWRWMQSH